MGALSGRRTKRKAVIRIAGTQVMWMAMLTWDCELEVLEQGVDA